MNPVMDELIEIRPYIAAVDEAFVFNSALNGVYYGSELFKKIKKSVFIKHYRTYLTRTLTRPDASVRIACLKSDHTEMKGYAVLLNHGHALLWVFVKPGWRKNGIAKTLLGETVSEVMNLTPVGESILKKHPHITFNPFI